MAMSELFCNFAPEKVSLRKRFLATPLMGLERITKNVAAESSDLDVAAGIPDRKGFVARVSPRHEKSVSARLGEMGLESYVALQQELHVWANGRRKMVDRVVIPSVVFVNCTETERREIVVLPSIVRFMMDRSSIERRLAVIPGVQIERLRFMLGQSDTHVEFAPTEFRINDTVRVIRGSLRGLEGEIRAKSDGTHTLIVSLSLLGGATVHIDPKDVEKLDKKWRIR